MRLVMAVALLGILIMLVLILCCHSHYLENSHLLHCYCYNNCCCYLLLLIVISIYYYYYYYYYISFPVLGGGTPACGPGAAPSGASASPGSQVWAVWGLRVLECRVLGF